MTEQAENTTPALISSISNLGVEAASILETNTSKADKAIAVGNNIIAAIETAKANGGITPDLDVVAQNYIAKCANALKAYSEARKPITQVLDMIKSKFIEQEGKVDIKKQTSPAYILQQYRNEYAEGLLKKQAEQKRLLQIETDKAQEIIDIRSEFKMQFASFFAGQLRTAKENINNAFNKITLDNIADKGFSLNQMQPQYSREKFNSFAPSTNRKYVYASEQTIKGIKDELLSESLFTETSSQYVSALLELKRELIDKLPSKRAELEEQEKLKQEMALLKNEEDKKRKQQEMDKIEAEKIKREQDEKDAIFKQAKEQEEAALRKASEEKLSESTMQMFEAENMLVEEIQTVNTKQGVEILINHQSAYVLIFNFWYEREGKDLLLDKMERTTLGQMKSYCEKTATKTGETIESKLLTYKQSIKAK